MLRDTVFALYISERRTGYIWLRMTLLTKKVAYTSLALTDLDVNEQISVFNDTITNVMLNFVIVICDDRDPSWMSRHTKNLILYKDNFYERLYTEKNRTDCY